MTRRRKTSTPPTQQPVGEDGWLSERAAQAQRLETEAAYLRTLEHVVMKEKRLRFPALMDAFDHYRKRDLPQPPWVHEPIREILDHWYNAKKKHWERDEAERERREKHLRRHELVEELLDRRDELTELFKRMGDPEPQVKYETAPDKAAEHAGEKTSTVRASYMKIQRERKSGDRNPLYVPQYRASAKNRAQFQFARDRARKARARRRRKKS
jgi:hypothetical protein